MSLVILQVDGPVGTIQLNHPAKRNALSGALVEEVVEAQQTFQKRKLRVVVLRAAPGAKVWSAGHDVSELPEGRDAIRSAGTIRCAISFGKSRRPQRR